MQPREKRFCKTQQMKQTNKQNQRMNREQKRMTTPRKTSQTPGAECSAESQSITLKRKLVHGT